MTTMVIKGHECEFRMWEQGDINGDGTNEREIQTRISQMNAITVVNQGAKKFTIAGDQTRIYQVGRPLRVWKSTGNDGNYTIASVTYVAPNTEIVVVEVIPDATADGKLLTYALVEIESLKFDIKHKITEHADIRSRDQRLGASPFVVTGTLQRRMGDDKLFGAFCGCAVIAGVTATNLAIKGFNFVVIAKEDALLDSAGKAIVLDATNDGWTHTIGPVYVPFFEFETTFKKTATGATRYPHRIVLRKVMFESYETETSAAGDVVEKLTFTAEMLFSYSDKVGLDF